MVGLRGWAGLWCLGWLSEQGSLGILKILYPFFLVVVIGFGPNYNTFTNLIVYLIIFYILFLKNLFF